MLNASYRATPPTPLVGATFEHVAGPTKPITGVVRRRRPAGPWRASRSTAPSRRPGPRSRPGPTPRAASASSACPRASSIRSPPTDGPGVDPFLGAEITVTDTEGLKPIETTLELPQGVIVTGRLIDTATGRPVRARHVNYFKVPGNRNAGDGTQRPLTSLTDPTFRLTVPPGEGMIYAKARGEDLPTSAPA